MGTNQTLVNIWDMDTNSDEYREVLARLLGRIEVGKPYGHVLFGALARLTVSSAVEAVLLRRRGDRIEVYLTQREPDDAAYPNMWHAPGTIFRPGEQECRAMTRLGASEFGCEIERWTEVGSFRHQEERGWFLAIVYLVVVDGEPQNERGKWFDVENLPENTVPHHSARVIVMALSAYDELRR